MKILRYILFPISLLYSAVIFVRNRFFDFGILSSSKGAIPTIVLGNLSAGGTGKTPHSIYIINKLISHYRLGFLSRGYGRTTKGPVVSDGDSNATEIGDEPMQIKTRFPRVPVIVSESRLQGLEEMKLRYKDVELVVLDDAFQHRSLTPDKAILLMDYNAPWWNDFALPTGNLRDNVGEMGRADIIIVTKCPIDIKRSEQELYLQKIRPRPHQRVYFSGMRFGQPIHFQGPELHDLQNIPWVAFSGIAKPESFKKHIESQYTINHFRSFPDHHNFSQTDLGQLASECGKFEAPNAGWLTTEKDAMRLRSANVPTHISIYYIPMEVVFLNDEPNWFDIVKSIVR